jgi:hypothetical protein
MVRLLAVQHVEIECQDLGVEPSSLLDVGLAQIQIAVDSGVQATCKAAVAGIEVPAVCCFA